MIGGSKVKCQVATKRPDLGGWFSGDDRGSCYSDMFPKVTR